MSKKPRKKKPKTSTRKKTAPAGPPTRNAWDRGSRGAPPIPNRVPERRVKTPAETPDDEAAEEAADEGEPTEG